MEYPNSLYLIVIIFVLAGISITALAVAIQALNRETIVQVQGNSIAPTSLVQTYTPRLKDDNGQIDLDSAPTYASYLVSGGICSININIGWSTSVESTGDEVYVTGPPNIPMYVFDQNKEEYGQPLATYIRGINIDDYVVGFIKPDGDGTRIIFRKFNNGGSLTASVFGGSGELSVSGSFLVASTT